MKTLLELIHTKNNNYFISDKYSKKGKLLVGNYVMMFCNKAITPKGYSYEYPSIYFQNLNMCKKQDILNISTPKDIDLKIFETIRAHEKLTRDQYKYLRNNYLHVVNRTED